MTMPDPEKLAVKWAKNNAALQALNEQRVATRLPENWETSFLRAFLIDTDSILAETSDAVTAVLQFDAYAWNKSKSSPDYDAAWSIAATAVAELRTISNLLVVDEGMICDATATGPRRTEEPETNWARYTFEASLVVRP